MLNPFNQTCLRLEAQKAHIDSEYTLAVRMRLKVLKSLQLPINTTHPRPFLRIKSYYRISPRYNLTLCLVEKAMCTLLQNLFCYLYDTEGFVKNNRTIAADPWDARYCYKRNEVESTQEKYLKLPFNPSTIFMVRDPIERFISGFLDKCINENSTCYNCTGNVLCAVEGLHDELMKMSVEHWNITNRTHGPIDQSYEATHMAPSNWMCDLLEESDKYIFIRYEETESGIDKTYNELITLLEAHGVEKAKLKYISDGIKVRTKHATALSGLKEKYLQQLKGSSRHVHMLNKIYFYDHQIFGFNPLQ